MKYIILISVIICSSCQDDHDCSEGLDNIVVLQDTTISKYSTVTANYLTPIEKENLYYTKELDNGSILGDPARFETLSETYIQQPRLTRFQINPSILDTTVHRYIVGISENCDSSNIEKKCDSLLVHKQYRYFNEVRPVLAIRYEYVNTLRGGSPNYYESKFESEKSVIYGSQVNIAENELINLHCDNGKFINCLEPELVLIDTILNDCWICEDPFYNVGKYCYTDSKPDYRRLIEYYDLIEEGILVDSLKAEKIVLVQYYDEGDVKELESECLIFKDYETYEIIEEASYEEYEQPPKTYTYTWQQVVSEGDFEVQNATNANMESVIIKVGNYEVKVGQFSILNVVNSEVLQLIELKLQEKGIVTNIEKIYKNIFEYQQRENIPIGVIDYTLMKSLGIE